MEVSRLMIQSIKQCYGRFMELIEELLLLCMLMRTIYYQEVKKEQFESGQDQTENYSSSFMIIRKTSFHCFLTSNILI